MGRRLERHLDQDLIDRMAAGWTPSARVVPIKKLKPPRAARTYRAARRNLAIHGDVKTTWRSSAKRSELGVEPYYPKPSKKYPYSNERQNTRGKRRRLKLAA
jgi:hypothetical protein